LIHAEGREHPGQVLPTQPRGNFEFPVSSVPHRNDMQALVRYKELYTYDRNGNITQMQHLAAASPISNWTRTYNYFADSNRLHDNNEFDATNNAPSTATYTYNRNGAMTFMSHLPAIDWDYADRMKHANKNLGGGDVYFTYDGGGQRVRKVWLKAGNSIDERIYIGGWETFRQRMGSVTTAPTFERETLHVMDDQRRIAMVETKTIGPPPNAPRWRFQLTNLLGSSVMELDAHAHVITYEEYHPYGSTAFHSSGDANLSDKRYRYTGKEKDEETGLYYHGARYYVPWLGRWTAADPEGLIDGPNLYAYSQNNPVGLLDPSGTQTKPTEINNLNNSPLWQSLEDAPYELQNKAATEVTRVDTPTKVDGSLVVIKRGGGSLFMRGSDIPAGPSEYGNFFIYKDVGTVEDDVPIREMYPEDVNRYIPRGHSVFDAPITPERAAASAKELNADIRAYLHAGYSIDAAKAEVEQVHHEILKKLVEAYVYLFAGLASTAAGGGGGAGRRAAPPRLAGSGAAKEAEASVAYSGRPSGPAPKSADFAADLRQVTGRGAQARNAQISGTISKSLPNLRLTHPPQYNPFLKGAFGVSKKGVGSQIGRSAFSSQRQLIETIVHEELHHRWWARGIPGDPHLVPALDLKFEMTVQRYMSARGF
jgi:RHS repeat-associated protein